MTGCETLILAPKSGGSIRVFDVQKACKTTAVSDKNKIKFDIKKLRLTFLLVLVRNSFRKQFLLILFSF